MAFRQFSKEQAVKEAREFNRCAIFAARCESVPATVAAMRNRRNAWMRVARGEISHVFYA
ncbi:hypothetical protein LS633_25355 [Pseudomonas sp. NIBR-H-19]|uniref:hypothetical protein n=1 Tax=Pseudomonas sp. NIBR-H-19 TaxID=2901380 RepID=UPI001E426EA3|nr:hypothetical protein [Pseudomonas sp. NIBR-H-19]UHC81696.1 hypothetical protein LS633_25355 [Pseudomonas sp. NIBR-H-19]